jgi:hypothetical protein
VAAAVRVVLTLVGVFLVKATTAVLAAEALAVAVAVLVGRVLLALVTQAATAVRQVATHTQARQSLIRAVAVAVVMRQVALLVRAVGTVVLAVLAVVAQPIVAAVVAVVLGSTVVPLAALVVSFYKS